MRMWLWAMVAVVGIAMESAGRVDADGASNVRSPAGTVDRLMLGLGDMDWKVRQRAQEELVGIGESILPQLRASARATNDEEVRSRLAVAIREIEAAARWGPTRIRVHAAAPAGAVLAEVARQAKIDIVPESPEMWLGTAPRIALDAENEPFWTVLDRLCHAMGVVPSRDSSLECLILQRKSADAVARRTLVQQGYLVTAEAMPCPPAMFIAMPPVASTPAVRIGVMADPKVRIVRGERLLKLAEAVDERGNSLLARPNTDIPEWQPAAANGWRIESVATLRPLPYGSRQIASLKGQVELLIQSRSDAWVIQSPLIVQQAQRKIPGGRCLIKGIWPDENGCYKVRIAVEHAQHRPAKQDPITDLSSIQRSLRLVDDDGQEYQWRGISGGEEPGRVEYVVRFAPPANGRIVGAPARIVWNLPVELRIVTVPFHFTDLPLP